MSEITTKNFLYNGTKFALVERKRVQNMRAKLIIVVLLGFIFSCVSGNPHVSKQKTTPANPTDTHGQAAPAPRKTNQSQPVLLKVTSILTFPNQQRISAKMFFYSPSAEKKPEDAKMELKEFVQEGSSQPTVKIIVRGESDLEGKVAVLSPMDSKTFSVETQGERKTLFQHFSIQMGATSSLKPEMQLNPGITIALPQPVFLLKPGVSDRRIPEAEDLLDEVVLSKSKEIPIGHALVLEKESEATYNAEKLYCALEATFIMASQQMVHSFQLKNIEGDVFIAENQSLLAAFENGARGQNASIVCKTEVGQVPGRNAKYKIRGETRTLIPNGIRIVN